MASPFASIKQFFTPNSAGVSQAGNPFVTLDTVRMAQQIDLERRARENGARNYPPIDARTLDDVESEIVSRFEEARTRAEKDASAIHHNYSSRLAELRLLHQLPQITQATRQALGEFTRIVTAGKGRLHNDWKNVESSYNALEEFKRDHGLRRPAKKVMLPLYSWSLLAVSWVIESAVGMTFLWQNDDMGIFGGMITALVIAGINIGISAVIGRLAWPLLHHKSIAKKITGLIISAVWLVLMLSWNLFAGHYRDAKSSGAADFESAALAALQNTPFQFDGLHSYGIVAIGITFAFLAALTAFKMDDPYPGYGDVYRQHKERCDDYQQDIEDALDELKFTSEEAMGDAIAVREELGQQSQQRQRLLNLGELNRTNFHNYQLTLQAGARTLLEMYRRANVAARTDGASPQHFDQEVNLRISTLPELSDLAQAVDVERVRDELNSSIIEISDKYEEAIVGFVHQDRFAKMIPDGQI